MSTRTRSRPEPPRGVDVYPKLLELLRRLSAANLTYTLRHSRDDAIMVQIWFPGEYWEVDFLQDGEVDVEVFRSKGDVHAADDSVEKMIEVCGRADAEGPL